MTKEETEAEYLKARIEQHKKPLPYPMTEAEKRGYDYADYKREEYNTFDRNEEP